MVYPQPLSKKKSRNEQLSIAHCLHVHEEENTHGDFVCNNGIIEMYRSMSVGRCCSMHCGIRHVVGLCDVALIVLSSELKVYVVYLSLSS